MLVTHTGVLPVILSAAKDLCVRRARPFAALRVTRIISKCLRVGAIPCGRPGGGARLYMRNRVPARLYAS